MRNPPGWFTISLLIGAIFAPATLGQSKPATETQSTQAQSSPAAQSTPPGRRLMLSEALALADRQNLDLAAARLRHAVAVAGILTAGARPNPTVSFSAT